MSPRVLRPPPPDPPLEEREPPEGYEWEWVEPDDRRVAASEEKATKKCRRPGCDREPVMALLRGFGRSRHWWLYCDWHTYGSRIEGDKVLTRRLRPRAAERSGARRVIHNRTNETHAADGTLTMSEMERRERAHQDAQIITTRCARCEWIAEGPAADVHEQFLAHARAAHPAAFRVKRQRRSKLEERADAMVGVAARRGFVNASIEDDRA